MKTNDPINIWFVQGDELFQFGLHEYYLIAVLKGHYEGDIEIPDDDTLI